MLGAHAEQEDGGPAAGVHTFRLANVSVSLSSASQALCQKDMTRRTTGFSPW